MDVHSKDDSEYRHKYLPPAYAVEVMFLSCLCVCLRVCVCVCLSASVCLFGLKLLKQFT